MLVFEGIICVEKKPIIANAYFRKHILLTRSYCTKTNDIINFKGAST